MLVFMDESGDDGIKLDAGSSKRFLFAAVAFRSREDADACRAAIAAFRMARGLAEDFEFRHASTPPRLLRDWAASLAPLRIEGRIAGIEKTGFPHGGFRHRVQAAALRMFGDRLRRAKVFGDEFGGSNGE